MSTVMVAVPLGLAAAVSPVMLAEQTVLVSGPGGRRAGCWYAAGTALVLVALCAVVALFGQSVVLPHAPHLNAGLDIALGTILLLLALVARRSSTGSTRRPRLDGDHPRWSGGPRPIEAFAFGLFSMATDVTTLTIVLVAARDVSASGSAEAVRVLALLVLIGLATLPAWAPLLAATVPGGGGQAAMSALGRFIDRHGRVLLVVLLVVVGALLVGRGVLHLAGILH